MGIETHFIKFYIINISMEQSNTSCLVESKKEYTNLLIRRIKEPIMNTIMNCFANVKKNCSHTRDEEKVLIFFQDYLERIPEWQKKEIDETTQDIIRHTKCDYLEDILFAVFILHTRIFDAIEPSPDNSVKSKIVFPNISNFIFQTLVNVARENWKYVYLFKEASNSCEYQQNRNKCESIIEQSIRNTITEMLPVRDILQDHIQKYAIQNLNKKSEIKIDDDEDSDYDEDVSDNLIRQLHQLNRISKIKRKILKKQNGGNNLNEVVDYSLLNKKSENNQNSERITATNSTSKQNDIFQNHNLNPNMNHLTKSDNSISDTSNFDTSNFNENTADSSNFNENTADSSKFNENTLNNSRFNENDLNTTRLNDSKLNDNSLNVSKFDNSKTDNDAFDISKFTDSNSNNALSHSSVKNLNYEPNLNVQELDKNTMSTMSLDSLATTVNVNDNYLKTQNISRSNDSSPISSPDKNVISTIDLDSLTATVNLRDDLQQYNDLNQDIKTVQFNDPLVQKLSIGTSEDVKQLEAISYE